MKFYWHYCKSSIFIFVWPSWKDRRFFPIRKLDFKHKYTNVLYDILTKVGNFSKFHMFWYLGNNYICIKYVFEDVLFSFGIANCVVVVNKKIIFQKKKFRNRKVLVWIHLKFRWKCWEFFNTWVLRKSVFWPWDLYSFFFNLLNWQKCFTLVTNF